MASRLSGTSVLLRNSGVCTEDIFSLLSCWRRSPLSYAVQKKSFVSFRHSKELRLWKAEAVESSLAPIITSSPMRAAAFSKEATQSLFTRVSGPDTNEPPKSSSKVTVVGVGNVGMACAQTILTEALVEEIALVDVQADKLRGEMLDLQHAAAFLPRCKVVASTDYAITANSDLCIVTAGARQREGESRLSLVARNVSLLKMIIPKLVEYSPNTILLIISNPVDILTWASWKISGFPSTRVIGSGTNLDSSRFRFLIADALDINTQNVHGYIIGEHGDSSVPLWSSVNVGGIPVIKFLESEGISYNSENLKEVHQRVVQGAMEVISLKGYTSWAIGYSVASLTNNLLHSLRRVQPVSVLAKGFHGIEEEVYLSLPALLGKHGVISIANTPLSPWEQEQLLTSAKTLWNVQKTLEL